MCCKDSLQKQILSTNFLKINYTFLIYFSIPTAIKYKGNTNSNKYPLKMIVTKCPVLDF